MTTRVALEANEVATYITPLLAHLSHPHEDDDSVPWAVPEDSRMRECGGLAVRVDLVFMPLLRAVRNPVSRATLARLTMSPLQTGLFRLLDPIRIGGVEAWNVGLVPLLPLIETETCTRFAAMILSGANALLFFSWSVLPSNAASDKEAPALCLWFTLENMDGPTLCIVPYGGDKLPGNPRLQSWSKRLTGCKSVQWRGVTLCDPTVCILPTVPVTHYVSMDKLHV